MLDQRGLLVDEVLKKAVQDWSFMVKQRVDGIEPRDVIGLRAMVERWIQTGLPFPPAAA